MCIDLRVKNSVLQELNLAANLLGNMFCESLTEYISYNQHIQKLDISSNQIEESNATTLKSSLTANPRIIQFDVRRNGFTPETEEEINDLITKNYLTSKNITYKKHGEGKELLTLFCNRQNAIQIIDPPFIFMFYRHRESCWHYGG